LANPEVAYVGFSGYRYGFKDAHIYKTTNAGTTWTRISNDLPQVPVNDVEIDPVNANTLYLGTDIGVYYSTNGGTNWVRLGKKMPHTVVSTLNFAVNSRQLYAATYGRSVFKIDLSALLLPATTPTIAKKKHGILSISPNPARDYAVVKLRENKQGAIINVYSNNGALKFTRRLQPNVLQQNISLQNLNGGIYTVVCVIGDDKLSAKLIVKK